MKAFSAVGIVLLPFLLAACNEATPSTDATERMFFPIDPN
jgi:hypothetical protein